MPRSRDQITQLLRAWSGGDENALIELTPLVYKELHRLAKAYLSHEKPGQTLQPTALVNEAYIRLIDSKSIEWNGRSHFMVMAARLMRRILIDFARARRTSKRGAGQKPISLDGVDFGTTENPNLILLDHALRRLESTDQRKCQIVELRYFAGLTVEETAQTLGISPMTVIREWNLAKLWLLQQITDETNIDN